MVFKHQPPELVSSFLADVLFRQAPQPAAQDLDHVPGKFFVGNKNAVAAKPDPKPVRSRFNMDGAGAIADGVPDHAVDPAGLGFVDDLGNPKPGRVALGLLRQPNLVPQLVQLNANMKLALRSLASAIQIVIQSLKVG